MKNLIFIGMIGSKMKLIAEEAANKLNRKFVDTDEVITRNIGMTLLDFYTLFPLDSFNDITYRLSSQLAQGEDYVIAVGDSILNNADAMNVLKESGFIVYIEQDVDSIISECADLSHPLLARGITRIPELFAEREALFTEYSDIVIPFSENAADDAIEAYNNHLESLITAASVKPIDPALHAFFRYYIENINPNLDSASFADECSSAVLEILNKFMPEG